MLRVWYILPRSVQRANYALVRTYGCIIYTTGVGIQTLFILLEKASDGRNGE